MYTKLTGRKCLTLPEVVPFQIGMHLVQYLTFAACPKRSDQKRLRAVAGEPVYDDIGPQSTQTIADDLKIFFHIRKREGMHLVICGKVRLL